MSMPRRLQKTSTKYEQGTEETSLGAPEMDSTDTRGDYKYTMDASSQAEVVCQTGINSFSWQTLRNKLKGTLRWHIVPWCQGDWTKKEIKPTRHEVLHVLYKGNKVKFKRKKERKKKHARVYLVVFSLQWWLLHLRKPLHPPLRY